MSSQQRIELARQGAVAIVTLTRPEARNAIDDAMRTQLAAALEDVSADDSVHALVLTAQGTAFCAGGDVAAMRQRLEAPATEVAINGWRRQRRTHHLLTMLHELDKPVIAAVNGAAVGLGCDLALCCDFVIAADAATFAMSYVQRGLIPDGGGLYWLPRRVGLARAKELIFTGRTVAAEEALRLGLADRLAPAADLLASATAWAGDLASQPPAALALSKSILDRSFELSAEAVFALGAQAQAISYSTADHRASVEAFLARGRRSG